MKITLNNFQIFESSVNFTFNPGINLIIGPNASGKSTIFYALENLLTNPSGVDDCINYNCKEASVTLENNSQSITWKRKNGSSSYVNNLTGQEFIKASKLDSRDIAPMGFYFNDSGCVVNIHDEWSVLFPFGESDAGMFRLFEDIFNVSKSFIVVDQMKKDLQDIKQQVSFYRVEKDRVIKQQEEIQSLLDKVNEGDINYYIDTLDKYEMELEDLRTSYSNYSNNQVYQNIKLPEVFNVSELYEQYYKLEALQNDYNKYQEAVKLKQAVLPDINISLDFSYPTELKHDFETYCVLKQEIKRYNEDIELLEAERIDVITALKKINVCPTCGQKLVGGYYE